MLNVYTMSIRGIAMTYNNGEPIVQYSMTYDGGIATGDISYIEDKDEEKPAIVAIDTEQQLKTLLTDTEREVEVRGCLEDENSFELNTDIFYNEVVCKKRMYVDI